MSTCFCLFACPAQSLICRKHFGKNQAYGVASVINGNLQPCSLSPCRKYEEISPPELNEFVYITDSTYTKKQLVRMEHIFLRVLAFKMAAPTANQFLRLFMSIHSVSANTENLALVREINLSNVRQTSGPPILKIQSSSSLNHIFIVFFSASSM